MDIRSLLKRLRERNIDISLQDENLKISSDQDLDESLLRDIRQSKVALLAYLKGVDSSAAIEHAIPVMPVLDGYPLSSAQRRLWILCQFEGGSTAYNMYGGYVFETGINIENMNWAFCAMMDRHEILRTVFKENSAGELKQYVLSMNEITFSIQSKDVRNSAALQSNIVRKFVSESFDLACGPLVRIAVLWLEDDKYVLLYVVHHIISDGRSMDIMINELMTLYHCAQRNVKPQLHPLRIHYKDYAAWQVSRLNDNTSHLDKNYWLNQFSGELPVLELPGKGSRPAVKTYNGGAVQRLMTAETSRLLRDFSLKSGGTIFMGLVAAVNILLYRYTGQEDIILGTPVFGRDYPELEDQIGLYVNTLPLRLRFDGRQNFTEIFTTIKQITLDAYEHQRYPFDELVAALQLPNDASRNPIFDVMVSMQNFELEQQQDQINSPSIQSFDFDKHLVSKFDIIFGFAETVKGVHLSLEFNSDLYTEDFAAGMLCHLERIIFAATNNIQTSASGLEYLREEETLQLQRFNDTACDFRHDKSLIGLFEEQVANSGEKTALVFEGIEYSFASLNESSNKLAAYLIERHHIQAGELVCLRLERSQWLIISILAVLKTGAAYVPIDPDYPEERIQYILSDTAAKIVVDRMLIDQFESCNENFSCVNSDDRKDDVHSLAYVLYTSGSTGNPKGCMLEHYGVVNRIDWMWKKYSYTADDVILQKTTYSFDVSVWEIFMPLCWGCKMILCNKDDVYSPLRISEMIRIYGVTCLHFVPSMLNRFVSEVFSGEDSAKKLGSLRVVIASGEALPAELVRRWYEKLPVPIANLYGPTEASIDVTYFDTSKNNVIVPIGKPISNVEMFVVDAHFNLVPVGVVGEICIGGTAPLARGYLNNPALTSDRFLQSSSGSGQRIYRTGDVGRWLANGNIEFFGRRDDQVKIIGHRIELGEIVNALNSIKDIEACHVQARHEGKEDVVLVAFVVCKREIVVNEIRAKLAQRLPAFMIPSVFVQLDQMPLNKNGKTDVKALRQSQGTRLAANAVAEPPRNEMESKFHAAWIDMLGVSNIGVLDNFFDAGGTSMKIIKLAKVLADIAGRKVTIAMIFQYPDIRSLVDFLEIESSGEPVLVEDAFEGAELFDDLNQINID